MRPFINPCSWITPGSSPRLISDEIHIWRLDLGKSSHYGPEQLLDHESQRYEKIQHPLQAKRFLGSRIQIRDILSGYCGVSSDRVEIRQSALGKPFLGPGLQNIQFNLSHTGDIALLAVTPAFEVGIDIEAVRQLPRKTAISRRVFSLEIQSMLENATRENDDRIFFEQWTRMEAAQKTFGKGIFSEKIDHHAVGMYTFLPENGFVATLAWSDPAATPAIRFFKLDNN